MRWVAFTVLLVLATAPEVVIPLRALPAQKPPATATRPAAPPPEARIDINHASVDELMKVPGMTRSWAGRIVRFRPYRAKTDLLENGVLPSDVYDRIKDFIVAHRDKK